MYDKQNICPKQEPTLSKFIRISHDAKSRESCDGFWM